MISKEEMDKLETILFGHDGLLEKIRRDEKELKVFLKQQQKYKENQMKGIQRAKQAGYRFGRRRKITIKDKKVQAIMKIYDSQDITAKEAMQKLNIARATFYRLRKEWINMQFKEKEYESFK